LLTLVALVLAAGSAVAAEPAPGPTATELRERARSIVGDSRYQDRLDGERVPRARLPRDRQYVRKSGGTRGPRTDPTSNAKSGIGTIIMWLLIGILGACLIFFVVNELVHRKRRKRGKSPIQQAPDVIGDALDVEDTMPATLTNAQRLAAEGRLEDAVHLLLQGAIDYVAQLARFLVGDAMTSREVLRGATLDDASHQAFGQLVTSVEVSLFGGETATEADFERCSAAFRHLHGRLQA
jgi:hypothetical protein